MNPFVLKGYAGPEYFCDREKETAKLISSITNQQDLTLYAYRRYGKSALIWHVFHSLGKAYDCIYADIWGTSSLDGFISELANAVIRSKVNVKKSLGKRVTGLIRSIGASLSIGMDGRPSVDLYLHNKNKAFETLDELLNFLNNGATPVVLAIDEFQEIKNYADGAPLEARLRSITQNCQNIRFIYSGSHHHLLNEIFSAYNAPFYQSTRMIELQKIPAVSYRKFILQHFHDAKKQIGENIVEYVLETCHQHTYYVQAVCNFLFSQSELPDDIPEIERLYVDYIADKKVFYRELPTMLTKSQFAVVKSIAHAGLVKSPTSSDFMISSGVRSASSMQRIIQALLDKQVIIREDGLLRLYDVFLEHYLKYFVQ